MSDSPEARERLQLLTALMASEDAAVYAWNGVRLEPLVDPPAWALSVVDPALRGDRTDETAFLGWFVQDARAHWESGSAGVVSSGPWSESLGTGAVIHLEASATRAAGRCVLTVRRIDREYGERQELQRMARELALQHRALEREIAKKDVLLHCLVHDLRNPLANLGGCLEMLEGPDTERQREVLGMAKAQLQRQEQLIDDLLSVFRAEVEQLSDVPPPDEHPQVDAAIARASLLQQPLAESAQVVLETRLSGIGPHDTVTATLHELTRVLANLIDNAIRHTPPSGRISLTARAEGDAIAFVVDDDGDGLPDGFDPFDKFASTRGGVGGVGLGLYFCRLCVTRWGGTIEAGNRRDARGARFMVRLPRTPNA